MVAKIVCGKSIRGVLSYNELKVRKGEAELLFGEGFLTKPARLSFKSKVAWFERLTSQNERTKTNTLHISLNFSRRDQVTNESLECIAREYMERIGFGSQPFLVYRHYDAAHPHIHIATVNIAYGGSRIETHNIGRNLSEPARKAIEVQFQLLKAEDQAGELRDILVPVELERALYGKADTKKAISRIVLEVISSYKYTSLPELNAVLGQFGVRAERGAPSSAMYERRGLVYTLIDEKGNRVGVPIKASSIYSSPTLANLERRFIAGSTDRKPYAQRLKYQVDKALCSAADPLAFQQNLRQQGIRVLLRKNTEGSIYGVTFIDNATRSVFNGSDLGKAYSASALAERLEPAVDKVLPVTEGREAKAIHPHPSAVPELSQRVPATDLPAIAVLWDLALGDKHEESMPDPLRKKRKRLGIE